MSDAVARATAGVFAGVELPAVIAAGWPAALKANADTIRAALFSGEALHAISARPEPDVGLLRKGERWLGAWREKKGWVVRLGPLHKRADCFAARAGSKHIGSRVRMSRIRVLFTFNRYDQFDWQEVEEMMLQFISTVGNPRSVHWVGLDWPER